MAEYSIISKDGSTVKATGAPVYYGTYLKPGYLEFGEIGSPTPISLEAGDYVDYNRTGLRYKLYNTPKVTKQGELNLYGGSFVYENVQFFDATKELEIAPFVDLVPFDNLIHFSTRNTVSFYGTPANVAERIQACLDYWFPSSLWEVVIVSGLDSETDAELIETLATETEFSVSGVSCLGALDQIYEKWNGLGWSYSYSGGRNRIVIGAPNKRTSANITTTYGRIGDNGLVTIARSVSNADNMGTRLYAYGSMRNMPTDYYRSKGIKDAESVDIEHLMIPINEVAGLDYNGWGRTDGLPDARLAYIENASAIAKHGLIPRYAYFDGSDNNYPEIFPSISGATIGDVIDGKAQISDTSYVPSLSVWNRADRIDEIVSAINPDDDGGSSSSGVQYDESSEDVTDASIIESNGNPFQEANIGDYAPTSPANKLHAVLSLSGSVTAGAVDHVIGLTATVRMIARSSSNEIIQVVPIDIRSTSTTGRYEFVVEDAVFDIDLSGMTGVSLIYTVETSGVPGDYTFNISAGEIFLGWSTSLEKTFKVTIPQIGFNILQYADLGGGKKISMIDGMCAARDFPIKAASYVRGSDSWSLTLGRIKDSDTGLWYPNTDYQIAPGDRYVLLGIAMPELYISMASIRLLKEAQRLLENISSESPFYEPGIDSKKVLNENRILREGMWMHLYGDEIIDGGEDYALIDTLRIDEGASNIPVYEVSLRKRKPIEWTETISGGGSTPSSSPVESESQGSSSPQPSLDWFISETYEENGETRYRLKLNPKYVGMYAEGWVSSGGISDTSGGGSSYLRELLDVDDNIDSTSNYGKYLYYDGTLGKWTAKEASGTQVTEETVAGWGFTKNIGTVTQVKVGDTAYNPSNGVVSLPAYPTTLPASDVSAWAKKSSLDAVDVPSLAISKITGLQSALDAKAAASDLTVLQRYFTDGSAKSALRLAGSETRTAWGRTYWSSGVPASISGDMTGVGRITMTAQQSASSSGNVLEVVNVGTASAPVYALHSTLPIYSDSWVSAGGIGSSGDEGGASWLRELRDVDDNLNPHSGDALVYDGSKWTADTIDLTGFVTTSVLNTALAGYATTSALATANAAISAAETDIDTLQGNFTGGVANSAARLQDSRTIWGQPFDGTNNVDGILSLSYASTDRATGIEVTSSNSGEASIGFASTNRTVFGRYADRGFVWGSVSGELMTFLDNGNVGVGMNAPAYKLDVNGDIRSGGRVYVGSAGGYLEVVNVAGEGETPVYALKSSLPFYSDSWVSAGGVSTAGSGGGGSSYLRDLLDVDVTTVSPVEGNALMWDSLTQKWVARDVTDYISGYLPLTGGTMAGVIEMPSGTGNSYNNSYSFRFIDGNGDEVAKIQGASGENSTTGAAQSWIGYRAISGHEFFVDGARRFTINAFRLSPNVTGTLSLTSAGALSSLGDGYDLGATNRYIRALFARAIYLNSGVYSYYDSRNSVIRIVSSGSDITYNGVSIKPKFFYGRGNGISGNAYSITATGFTSDNLTEGTVLTVYMTYPADTQSNVTINVNSTGDKSVFSSGGYKSWGIGDNVILIYTNKGDWSLQPTYAYIANHVSGGGSGGSTVTVTPIVESGTKLATITVNGSGYDIYAPSSGGSYTLPAATSNALGGIRIGYEQSGKTYPVELDGNNRAYVNVPWTSGSGGSTVSVAQGDVTDATNGTLVGRITVDGTATPLYAPKVSVHQILDSGVSIATIKIGSANAITLYAPDGGSGTSGVASVAGYTGTVTTTQIATALTNAGYKLTDTVPDLSGYVTTNGLNSVLGGYVSNQALTNTLSSYATTASLGSYLPLSAGSGKALTGTLYASTMRPSTNSTSQSTGYDLGASNAYWKNTYTRRVYLADGIYVYYDSTNQCIRTNAPIASDSWISAGGVSTT